MLCILIIQLLQELVRHQLIITSILSALSFMTKESFVELSVQYVKVTAQRGESNI